MKLSELKATDFINSSRFSFVDVSIRRNEHLSELYTVQGFRYYPEPPFLSGAHVNRVFKNLRSAKRFISDCNSESPVMSRY